MSNRAAPILESVLGPVTASYDGVRISQTFYEGTNFVIIVLLTIKQLFTVVKLNEDTIQKYQFCIIDCKINDDCKMYSISMYHSLW